MNSFCEFISGSWNQIVEYRTVIDHDRCFPWRTFDEIGNSRREISANQMRWIHTSECRCVAQSPPAVVLFRPHKTLQPSHVVGVAYIEWVQVDARPVHHVWDSLRNWWTAGRRTLQQNGGRTIDWMQILCAVVEKAVAVRVKAQARRSTDFDEGERALQQPENGKQHSSAACFIGLGSPDPRKLFNRRPVLPQPPAKRRIRRDRCTEVTARPEYQVGLPAGFWKSIDQSEDCWILRYAVAPFLVDLGVPSGFHFRERSVPARCVHRRCLPDAA